MEEWKTKRLRDGGTNGLRDEEIGKKKVAVAVEKKFKIGRLFLQGKYGRKTERSRFQKYNKLK